MTASEMFEKLGYKRNVVSKKLIYTKNLKGMFRYLEITFDLTEKEVELYDDKEAYTVNNALLKAIYKQVEELGWFESVAIMEKTEFNLIRLHSRNGVSLLAKTRKDNTLVEYLVEENSNNGKLVYGVGDDLHPAFITFLSFIAMAKKGSL